MAQFVASIQVPLADDRTGSVRSTSGSVRLEVEVDLDDISPEDREFVNDLVRMMCKRAEQADDE